MKNSTQTIADYLQQFNNVWKPDGMPEIYTQRKQAMDAFMREGFPTRRMEDWRFTNLSKILEFPFEIAPRVTLTASVIDAFLPKGWAGPVISIVNGHFDASLSRLADLPDAVKIRPVNIEPLFKYDTDAFTFLNTAYHGEGVSIHIEADALVEKDILLLYLMNSEGGKRIISCPRTQITVGKNAKVTIVENSRTIGSGEALCNRVCEIQVDEGADLQHSVLQMQDEHTFHFARNAVRQKTDSNYNSVFFTFGAQLARNTISAWLDGEGIRSVMNGLYLTHASQLVDNHSFIDHACPNCESHELFRGILQDKSRGVFSGKILVRPDAQKTDAKQSNNSLLLSDEARMDSMPQLEIYADDVKCTHGATIGQLDEDALFYLRARGIPLNKARGMLTDAFAREVIESVENESVKELITRLLADRLGHDL